MWLPAFELFIEFGLLLLRPYDAVLFEPDLSAMGWFLRGLSIACLLYASVLLIAQSFGVALPPLLGMDGLPHWSIAIGISYLAAIGCDIVGSGKNGL